jgi:origin recognition complex subunit 6
LPAPTSTPSRGTPGGTGLGSARVRTPSTKLREQQLLGTSPLANKSKGPPSKTTTPSKEKSLSQLRNPTTTSAANTPSKKRTLKDPLPRWIRPTLRLLTTALGPVHIGPIVASGLESIITPDGKLTDDAWVLANLAPVLGALYLYVWRGVTWPGRELDRERYVKFRKEVADVLGGARDEVEILREEEGDWEGWREVGVREFDTAALRGNRHGWFEMEWVSGVGDLVDREMDREEAEAGEKEEGRDGPVQIQRADTMFQERYDYLSERKRKAYSEWKVGMMKRIKELEA